jgi:pyruvate,water dikinase
MISHLTPNKVPTGFKQSRRMRFASFWRLRTFKGRINASLSKLILEDVPRLSAGQKLRHGRGSAPSPLTQSRLSETPSVLSADNPQAAAAVRSSATAEDLPDRTICGPARNLLNATGIDAILHKMKEVFASFVQRPRDQLPCSQRVCPRACGF